MTKTNRIKVAIITNIPAPYRVDLFQFLQENYNLYEFHVIYTNRNEDNRNWNLDQSKLKNSYILKSIIIKKKQELDYRYIHIPKNLGKTLNKIKPNVIIGFEYNLSALFSLHWAHFHKIPYINLTDGTLYSERNIGKFQKFLRKHIIKKADAYLASSTKAREKLQYWKAEESKIFLSYLTVNTSPFTCKKDRSSNQNLLYVGSFIKRKGLDLLLNTLSSIQKDFILKIVGNGTKEEIEKIHMMILDLKLEKKVIIESFKRGKELIEEYKKADIFILPSREDCFGLVLIEALCSHTPMISSKFADGSYDVIVDGENGYIIDPNDSNMFAKAIEKILSDEKLWKIMSNNCEKFIEKFKFENVAKGYIEAIQSVICK